MSESRFNFFSKKTILLAAALVIGTTVITRYTYTSQSFEDLNRCCPVTKMVFTKIEKTGSSTLYACFSRLVYKYKLNIMIMTQGWHLDTSVTKSSKPGWDIGPQKDEQADIMLDHAKVNMTLFKKYIKPEAKYLVSVRDPVSWFESAVHYWDEFTANLTSDEVAQRDDLLYVERRTLKYSQIKSIYHLNQLQWLGFDYSLRNDTDAMEQFVDDVVKRYNAVILTDQFDAGLVLIRRRLDWDYTDIFYHREGSPSSKLRTKLSPKFKEKILSKRFNYGELLLYQKLNETWWSNPETQQQDFWDEVAEFNRMNEQTGSHCASKGSRIFFNSYTFPANRWSPPVTIDGKFCEQFTTNLLGHHDNNAKYALGNTYTHF